MTRKRESRIWNAYQWSYSQWMSITKQ